MDFPGQRFHPPVISTHGEESMGAQSAAGAPATATSGGWASNNLGLFYPMRLAAPYLVKKLWWANGTTANANVDCGVYSAGGTLLFSAGSTAQSNAGASVIQSVTLGTAYLLLPGSYYLAIALSVTTGTLMRTSFTAGVTEARLLGLATQTSCVPLPATFTLVANTVSASIYLFGIASTTVI